MSDALKATLCRFVACMDDDELSRLDAFIMQLLEERSNWAKHHNGDNWHHVTRYSGGPGGGSVVLACNGRFPITDMHQLAGRPPLEQRCPRCQLLFVEANRDRLALELFDSGSTAASPPTLSAIDALPVAARELAPLDWTVGCIIDPDVDGKCERGTKDCVVGHDSSPRKRRFRCCGWVTTYENICPNCAPAAASREAATSHGQPSGLVLKRRGESEGQVSSRVPTSCECSQTPHASYCPERAGDLSCPACGGPNASAPLCTGCQLDAGLLELRDAPIQRRTFLDCAELEDAVVADVPFDVSDVGGES